MYVKNNIDGYYDEQYLIFKATANTFPRRHLIIINVNYY